mgnify:CR=1 FL=1|jgi:hypothetical protein
MKILIWIKKEDAISGNITVHHSQCPQPGYQNYIQVEVSRDEFARLEDTKTTIDAQHQTITAGNYTVGIDGPGIETSEPTAANYAYPSYGETQHELKSNDWLVSQYNRNRAAADCIKTRDEIPYIYEKDDKGNVYRRKSGDYTSDRELITNDVFKSSMKPINRNLKQLLNEYSDIQGRDFNNWWNNLSTSEQITITKFWE